MSDLASKKCVPCQGGVPALSEAEQDKLLEELDGWQLFEHHHLTKTFTFDSFTDAWKWINKLAECAEEQGHHPVINWNFKKVKVDIWTHKIDGLVESDFILAAKADQLPGGSPR